MLFLNHRDRRFPNDPKNLGMLFLQSIKAKTRNKRLLALFAENVKKIETASRAASLNNRKNRDRKKKSWQIRKKADRSSTRIDNYGDKYRSEKVARPTFKRVQVSVDSDPTSSTESIAYLLYDCWIFPRVLSVPPKASLKQAPPPLSCTQCTNLMRNFAARFLPLYLNIIYILYANIVREVVNEREQCMLRVAEENYKITWANCWHLPNLWTL